MNRPLYSNDRGLYPFQVDDVVKGYVMPSGIVAWDTGTGKSHWAMALAALLLEDDQIDLVVLIAEKNKIGDDEWVGDFRKFTGIPVHRYHGTGRMKRLEKLPEFPRALVTTYETAKADLVRMVQEPNKRGKTAILGPLGALLGDLRILVIFDESTKVKNRSSDNYKAMHWWVNKHLRKIHPETRVWGLTATPLETSYEDAFNQARLVHPPSMPTVKFFEDTYVRYRDPYGRPTYHTERMPEFAQRFQGIILRRRKTDPELIDQFPKMVEEARHFQMGESQRKFYELVEEIGFPEPTRENPDPEPEPGMLMLMRQIAGYPEAVLHSKGVFAQVLSSELGADYIRSIPSVKADGLIDYMSPLVLGQGAKAVCFTFFGPSMIPLLARDLRAKKMRVFTHWGGMTENDMMLARRDFRSCDEPAIFLSSDAGSRGINLPEATYLVEFESALTFSIRTQRINRIHRIDSTAVTTNAMTFILDDSVEERLALGMTARNSQHDVLMGDEDAGDYFLTADERKSVLRIARTKNPKRRL